MDRGGAELSGLVLDASAALAWCFEDEGGASSRALAHAEESSFVVPVVWPFEVTNGLAVAVRRGRLREADATRFLALLAQLGIEIEPAPEVDQLPGLLALARAHSLATYDASYLELALRRGLPLATEDAELARAARSVGLTVL